MPGPTAWQCAGCGKLFLPPVYTCPECSSTQFNPTTLSGQGVVYSFTTIYTPPEAFAAEAPYDIAMIELAEKLKATVRLLKDEGQEITIGGPVTFISEEGGKLVFRLAR